MAAKKASPKKKRTYNKFGNLKTVVDGITFDSRMEARYYEYINAHKTELDIKEIELQPAFVLQSNYKKYGKTIRAIKYIADFKITYNDDRVEIIDVKGKQTADFKLKRKLFDFKYPDLPLKCVTAGKKNEGAWIEI